MHATPDARARIRGCLLGGAVGDALGAPVEFDSLADIRSRFGAGGVTDYAEAYGRRGAITDDTQMTLFTAEGLVRAYVGAGSEGAPSPESAVHHAYLRWLRTQGYAPEADVARRDGWPDGWLVKERGLWSRRAPGNTCLSALLATRTLGERATNDSKGCGTVMRVAPVGLLAPARDLAGGSPAYELGAAVSFVTHGHPAGYMAGGAFALLFARLMEGLELRRAAEATVATVRALPGSACMMDALDAAMALVDEAGTPTPERIEQLGGGWVAEEALAIAIYVALTAKDFEGALSLSVTHSGDSDSTGSMVGQLLGAAWGEEAIPARWLRELELRDVVEQIADDVAAVRAGSLDREAAAERYPGW
jgi:ADP-ribosylglycohydrolase